MRAASASPLGLLLFPAVILGLLTFSNPALGLSLSAFYALVVWVAHRLEVLRARR